MLLVVNPEGHALNLDAAYRLSPLPPEFVDGPVRLLVVTIEGEHTVYGLTISEIITESVKGTMYFPRRWVRGVPPQFPGRAPPGQGSVTLGHGYSQEEADTMGAEHDDCNRRSRGR